MIKLTTRGIYIFSLLYIIIFSVVAFYHENYEFIYYSVVLLLLMNIIGFLHKRLLFSGSILTGLSIIGLMHILGGNLQLHGTRLYEVFFFWNTIKFDNLVHFFAAFIGTFLAYALILPFLDPELKKRPLGLYILMFLITMGLGAFNEVIEFSAVLTLNVEQWVGDYTNNALDLVYNALGSIAACFYIAAVGKIKVLQCEYRIAHHIK